MTSDPYDEVPYRSLPIEWTAPERLGLASLLHGGPRPPLEGYRVLEVGCANGANLLPQAFYRRHAAFVGVDGARSQIALAENSRRELKLTNIEFVHADFLTADQCLDGQFDYIIGHGVFSWVPDAVRDALLRLCANRLRAGGLFYLNYNAYPGWKVRGMVRQYLLTQAGEAGSLHDRAHRAQARAATLAGALSDRQDAYSQLLANEFQFVCDNDVSYVAHEYLSPDNRAYWRSEFLALARQYGFAYVADADFNYSSGRLSAEFEVGLTNECILAGAAEDAADLLCYRQLHSPILTRAPFTRRPLTVEAFADLTVASCLARCGVSNGRHPMFHHPSGYQVEAKEEVIHAALLRLQALWPRGLTVGELFSDVQHVMDDVRLLHLNGLIELRCIDDGQDGQSAEPLKRVEGIRGYFTTAYHTREAVA